MVIDIFADGAEEEPEETYEPAGENQPVEGLTVTEPAPGLTQKIYAKNGIHACIVELDSRIYTLRPALARGIVPGRQALSGIVRNTGAYAAVNASYFALNGDILGVTKIDGLVAGTTYFTRSAFGIMPDGSPVFGKVAYSGLVTIGDVTLPVSGVDAERGKDNLIIYNKHYGNSTRTNEYGTEYVIQNDMVTDIGTGNTPIPANGVVVSVHGAAQKAFEGAQIGDKAIIYETLGKPWDDAAQIVGAGPRLLANGRVNVTVAEEEFPGDIRYGRAPRSAVGVTSDGNFILAAVDGRQAVSRGCTLTEWAEFLKSFGVVDAINLDGGGSTEIISYGEILNFPSDGGERPVGSAIIAVPKKGNKK